MPPKTKHAAAAREAAEVDAILQETTTSPASNRSIALKLLIGLLAVAVGLLFRPTGERVSSNVSLLYGFGKGTWVENLAVRKNGNLVLTMNDKPEVWELNPRAATPIPKLLWRFENATGLTGITELTPDKFAVAVGRKGSASVWTLDIKGSPIAREVVESIPDAKFLNGITSLSPKVVLVADTGNGCLHKVDVVRGVVTKIEDLGMSTTIFGLGGINGVRIRGRFLYYTNSIRGQLLRLPLHPISGEPLGPSDVMVETKRGVDDFELGETDEGEEAYVMHWWRGEILRLKQTGGLDVIGRLPWPTSAQLGRTKGHERTLYVTSSGNPLGVVLKNRLEGGGVYKLEV